MSAESLVVICICCKSIVQLIVHPYTFVRPQRRLVLQNTSAKEVVQIGEEAYDEHKW